MDMTGNDTNVGPQKGSDVPVNYAPDMPSDWQVNGNNLVNMSIGVIPMCNSVVQSSARSSKIPMVDSFCPAVWDQLMSGQNLGYCDVNVQNDASTSSNLGSVRTDLGWASNAMLREGMFPPPVPGMLPQSLPHFPADSAFIERAARFSCFGGGNFGEMMNSFSVADPLIPYPRSLGVIQGQHEVLGGHGSEPLQEMQPQRHEMNTSGVSKDAATPEKHGTVGSPLKNEKRSESFNGQVKHGVGLSGNESDEAAFSGCRPQEEMDSAAGEPSGKGLGFKKRKRAEQDSPNDENNDAPPLSTETATDMAATKQKGDKNPSSISKPGGKNVEQGSQGLDPPKEEYIHIRARRGQATNSHSLAERVRREKISERMKFLQDLVPGCNKVTGKAVMLDEIINYVQSLQRQVEFLSMKLATVNPRLDFNIERLLAKDMLQTKVGMSSSLALLPDMTMPFPPLHPRQPGLIQTYLLGNAAETPQRPVNLQSAAARGGLKVPTSQVPNVWEDELHNVVHMGFNLSASLNSQDLSGIIDTISQNYVFWFMFLSVTTVCLLLPSFSTTRPYES